MFNILVVEDDRSTRKLIATILESSGFNVFAVEDSYSAMEVLDRQQVDLIVLDIMLPKIDGYTFTEELRKCGFELPVLMVTAKQTPADLRQGFLAGTDDYMTKPFDEEELILRIKALLRRARIASEHRLSIGRIILDYDSLTVTNGEESFSLPQKEFYLLFKLLSYPGVIFTRLQIMDEIWGMDSQTDERTVNVHINRLRDRFRDCPEFEIVTVRGLGYKVVKKI
jgi:DNA-binding response OmpR family regulator